MPLSPRLLIVVTTSLLLLQYAIAIPYLALTPTRPRKCVGVPYPKGAKLTVEYDFLEFDMGSDTLNIFIQPANRDDDFYNDDEVGIKVDANQIVNYNVPKKSGRVEYTAIGGHDLEICVGANTNGRKRMSRPTMVSLKFIESAKLDKDFFSLEFLAEKEEEKEQGELKVKETEVQKKGHVHLSNTEKSIYNLLKEASLVQGNADVQRKAEAKFFQKSKDMHASIKMW
eukprot:CAMPEP_0198264364 /NCGR_PEP_ID=MMETSP1447-20131203/15434_1 /TAXON_ID=420782 /ORGANISM="Chaetoceros dichaeta, Strain CCMP1751" /LENGTH=226 /DNA_ID=CAMNT_0043953265 /DNA_START=32 /DNA_END=709 /DNA_ORIENTATION=+